MLLSTRIKSIVALWFVVEALLFVLVVHLIGVGGAILLGIATSLFGMSLMRRAGASAMMKMRGAFDGRGGVAVGQMQNETLTTLGALALLMPGYLSDIVGIVMVTPVLRGPLAAWIGRGIVLRSGWSSRRPPQQHGPTTIDLEPEEWRQVDPARRSMPKV